MKYKLSEEKNLHEEDEVPLPDQEGRMEKDRMKSNEPKQCHCKSDMIG